MGRLLAFVLVVVAFGGCTRSVADSGAGCELDSECRSPLVCAGALCRPQCRTDRDCDRGESCVTFGADGVCVPPSSPVPCAISSDCGSARACVAGTCRATCASDAECSPGACQGGRCTMPVATPPVVDAGAPGDGVITVKPPPRKLRPGTYACSSRR